MASPLAATTQSAPVEQRSPEPASRARFRPDPVKLTDKEIEAAFGDRYGPVIGIDEVSEITGLAPATIARKLSEGWCRNCVRRGKPVRFLRNRFIRQFFGGGNG